MNRRKTILGTLGAALVAGSSATALANSGVLEPDLADHGPVDLITIRTPADATGRVAELLRYVWRSGSSLSGASPSRVDVNVADPTLGDRSVTASVDRLTVTMPHGVDSIVYLLHPQRPIGRLFLYHHGHTLDVPEPDGSSALVSALLSRGYLVAVLAMPLYAPNNKPVVELPRVGPLRLTIHNQLRLLETDGFSPLRLFLEPPAAVLNHVERRFRVESVAMAGLSGGGWTTTVYAALDPRIVASYPIAGSLPLHLRGYDWGDYEQTEPGFYRLATYPELHVLGAHGRRQVQFLIERDTCCFDGRRHDAYEGSVQDALASLGPGNFRVQLDTVNRGHEIFPGAIDAILADLD
jgi:hypothetical protein